MQIYSDSLPDSDNKIVNLLNQRTKPEYLYMLAEHYAADRNFAMASNSLNRILTEFDISREEKNEYETLLTYYNFYSNLLECEEFDLFNLDSATITEFRNFELYGGIAGEKARAVLLMNDASSYIEPIYMPMPDLTPKSKEDILVIDENYSFAIYPNPASNYINIEYNYQENEGDLEFAIIDNLGRMVHRTILHNKQDIIIHSTENLSVGLYYCIIFTGNKRLFNTKIIIQR